jgi:8-oxo-dGTP pyrophosphatase MutT (NUDIX family)
MNELWQLYDNQGRPITGQGATKNDVYGKALLHAASHVWIWRRNGEGIEVLLQKRAAGKRTQPGRYDISAAGHIGLGEDELRAAVRETEEEIGFTPGTSDLEFIGTHRYFMVAADKIWTENEIRFLYLLQNKADTDFKLEDGEVDSLAWKAVSAIKHELADKTLQHHCVPHGDAYFAMLFEALERTANYNLPTRAVKAVITNDHGDILFLQRDGKARADGKSNWDLPGGLVEPGEDDAAALAREIKEELNRDAIIGQELGKWTFFRPFDGQTVEVTNYAATLDTNEIEKSALSHEHLALKFVARAALAQLEIKDQSMLEALGGKL